MELIKFLWYNQALQVSLGFGLFLLVFNTAYSLSGKKHPEEKSHIQNFKIASFAVWFLLSAVILGYNAYYYFCC